jgi:hypothetical protein
LQVDRNRMRYWNRVRHRDRDWFRDMYWYRDVPPNRVRDRHWDSDCLGDPDCSYRQWKPDGVSRLLGPAQVDGLQLVGIAFKPTLPAEARWRADGQNRNQLQTYLERKKARVSQLRMEFCSCALLYCLCKFNTMGCKCKAQEA